MQPGSDSIFCWHGWGEHTSLTQLLVLSLHLMSIPLLSHSKHLALRTSPLCWCGKHVCILAHEGENSVQEAGSTFPIPGVHTQV